LSLSNNRLGPEAMEDISSVLQTINTTLLSLNVNYNCLDYAGADFLAHTLLSNNTLLSLQLGCCHLTRAGTGAIIRHTLENTSLQELHLFGNKISPRDMGILGQCLKIHNSLMLLNLWSCGIHDLEAVTLANCLEEDAGLRILILSTNHIRKQGALAFSKVIKANTPLLDLNLSYNQFGSAEVKQLQKALDSNTTLISLSLEGNTTGDEDYEGQFIKDEEDKVLSKKESQFNERLQKKIETIKEQQHEAFEKAQRKLRDNADRQTLDVNHSLQDFETAANMGRHIPGALGKTIARKYSFSPNEWREGGTPNSAPREEQEEELDIRLDDLLVSPGEQTKGGNDSTVAGGTLQGHGGCRCVLQ